MFTHILIVAGSGLISYKLGWEVGLGVYLCCYAICRQNVRNLITLGNHLIDQ